MIVSINKHKLKLSFFLFLAIFAPPVIPNVNLLYLLAFYSIGSMLMYYREYIKVVLSDRMIRMLYRHMLLMVLYFIFPMMRSILNNTLIEKTNYIYVIYRFVSIILIFFPICSYCVVYCQKHKLSMNDFIEVLIGSSLYEFVFCILTLVSSEIKNILVEIMINNTGYYYNIQPWTIRQRFWGFAASMTDYFGYTLGIIAGICLWYAIYKKQRYFIMLPILMLMIILNATTGLVIFAIFALTILGRSIINKKRNITNIIILLVFLLSVPLILYLLKTYVPFGYEKIIDNFYQIVNPSKVKAYNTSINDLLAARHWQIPNSIFSIIFGAGHSLLATEFFQRSDVGYINDIWSFGIVGMLIYMNAYIKFILAKKNKEFMIIKYSLVISALVFNIKGVAVGCNSGVLVTLLIVFTSCFLTKEVVG